MPLIPQNYKTMDYILEILRQNPVIPIFVVLGVGFWFGNLRWKSLSLGPVTATLIAGVVVGQLDIPVSETLKSVAFMVFLFTLGYSVGPQFFRSLRGSGLKMIGFALVECAATVATVVLVAKAFGFNKGIAAGLFAGSQTMSAVIGVGGDTIRALGLPEAETKSLIHIIPACYAATYVFGTIGSAWIIANLGPILMGGLKKVKAETLKLEEEMDSGDFVPAPGMMAANRPISFRAYTAESSWFSRPRTVDELERHMEKLGHRHFIERLRIRGEICDPAPEIRIRRGDTVVLSGRRESIVTNTSWIGPEIMDHELLNFETENLPVTVSKNGADGISLRTLVNMPYMKGVMVRKILRNDMAMPVNGATVLQKGDVVTLVGLPEDVAQAIPEIGYSDRQDGKTDIVFMSLGIAVGCFIGALGFLFDGIPVSLSTSGGAILAGLIMGWFRSKRPTLGHIPRSVLWLSDNMGLNLFIACVGLGAGPTFVSALQELGLSIFFIGICCTTIPLVACILIGRYLFKFPAAITMGCVAGGRNAVAALGAVQDSVDSTIPMIGYTVTYAVGSIMLIFAGMAATLLA